MLRINAKKVAICSIMINHTYTCSRWCLVQSWDSRASQSQSGLLVVFLISNDARFNGFSFFSFSVPPIFLRKNSKQRPREVIKACPQAVWKPSFHWSSSRPVLLIDALQWPARHRTDSPLGKPCTSYVVLAPTVRKSRSRASAKYGNYYTLSIIICCVI